ncbi:MAG: hypothetical protein OQL28_10320 [Sedimenticola sp.]|nr:hypothetical protein [Sedimenticola sp.]
MGDVTDFCRYRSRRDFDRKLVGMGWSPTRLHATVVEGTPIYLFDDATRLLLFALVQTENLQQISCRVHQSPRETLFRLAESLESLVVDFARTPPHEDDPRMALVADTLVWFAGFSLSLIETRALAEESIAVIRLPDSGRGESAFHLAHLEWPEVLGRKQASAQLARLAGSLRPRLLRR